jgi:hypothetical protein
MEGAQEDHDLEMQLNPPKPNRLELRKLLEKIRRANITGLKSRYLCYQRD